ncbi:MAG: peptide chain release factor N(5)-glutamine methyltransferase, partial [Chloroflexota bacterium]|nr:peptide chain release factor N(5)-glutamine methyltransferase [Chloroflexota bacterium]
AGLRSVGRAVTDAAAVLRTAGSPSPRLDAELLAALAIRRDRAWVVAYPDAPLDAVAAAELEAAVSRRATGEPIAYIRGYKEWLSLRLAVDERVLIPRPETELLAELAIAELRRRLAAPTPDERVVAWDVGTGSGAIAVAIGVALRDAVSTGRLRLVASDISEDALAVAASNLERHGLTGAVELAAADLLAADSGVAPQCSVDVVIANLPYVPSADVPRLPIAASFEPRTALDGGSDGLDALRRLLAVLRERLDVDGCALLEVGDAQADAVRTAAVGIGLRVDAMHRDLAGTERVVCISHGVHGVPDVQPGEGLVAW